MSQNVGEDRLGVAQHVTRRNAQCPKSLIGEPFVACFVMGLPASAIVRFPINLDGQLRFEAGEIEDEGAYGVLSPEPKTLLTFSQLAPQQAFGQGERPPQSTRIADGAGGASQHWAQPLHRAARGPPPRAGEELAAALFTAAPRPR